MFTNIPANWGASILAALALVFCSAPLLFIWYGKKIRQASKFAVHSLETYRENQVEK